MKKITGGIDNSAFNDILKINKKYLLCFNFKISESTFYLNGRKRSTTFNCKLPYFNYDVRN